MSTKGKLLGNRILFVGAHPDDNVIQAGGTIRRYLDEGHEVVLLTLSGSHSSERSKEEIKANEVITQGVNSSRWASYIGHADDTRMYKDLNYLIDTIEQYVKLHSIDTVFTHYCDAHQDHSAVHRATLAAGRNCDNIILYNPGFSGIQVNQASPNLTINLSEDQIKIKQQSLRCHYSQVKKYGEGDWIERQMDKARSDSWQYSGTHGYAETFIALRFRL
jgi:LmbE family N-acetylglucosaminyl deacetylase